MMLIFFVEINDIKLNALCSEEIKVLWPECLVSGSVYYNLKFEIQPTCSPILVKFHITKVGKM